MIAVTPGICLSAPLSCLRFVLHVKVPILIHLAGEVVTLPAEVGEEEDVIEVEEDNAFA
jgi:hypothetical protein